jgi:hypothetical protein
MPFSGTWLMSVGMYILIFSVNIQIVRAGPSLRLPMGFAPVQAKRCASTALDQPSLDNDKQ